MLKNKKNKTNKQIKPKKRNCFWKPSKISRWSAYLSDSAMWKLHTVITVKIAIKILLEIRKLIRYLLQCSGMTTNSSFPLPVGTVGECIRHMPNFKCMCGPHGVLAVYTTEWEICFPQNRERNEYTTLLLAAVGMKHSIHK